MDRIQTEAEPEATPMRLNPKHPPGRANRKARAFEAEIVRLRAEGYSCEAIRDALADAGVSVSTSTVRREVARSTTFAGELAPPAAAPLSLSPEPAAPPPHPLAGDPRSGKAIAAAFVGGRTTNPLLRTRSRDEDRRH